jgi:hypothetical protein
MTYLSVGVEELTLMICGDFKIAARAYGNPEHERVLCYPGW